MYFTTISQKKKKKPQKKTQDVFLFPTLNFDINHNSALLLVPFLLQFQWRPGLGLAQPQGRGWSRVYGLTENGWTLAEARPNKSWWTEADWDREKLSSPKEPRSKLLFVSKVSGSKICCKDRGRSHRQTWTHVLGSQCQSRDGFAESWQGTLKGGDFIIDILPSLSFPFLLTAAEGEVHQNLKGFIN